MLIIHNVYDLQAAPHIPVADVLKGMRSHHCVFLWGGDVGVCEKDENI